MHMCRDVDDEVRAEAQRGYTRPPPGTDLDSCALGRYGEEQGLRSGRKG